VFEENRFILDCRVCRGNVFVIRTRSAWAMIASCSRNWRDSPPPLDACIDLEFLRAVVVALAF